ncbi:MAG: histidinol dehydrogenase [Gemmatimonadota bacterium]|nr:histidinol dehydrogenase [Gemmatimonadota bacterium]
MRDNSNGGNLFLTKGIANLTDSQLDRLFAREGNEASAIRESASAILRDVQLHGDPALIAIAARFDGVELTSIEVPGVELERALTSLEPGLRRSMERSIANLESVQKAFMPEIAETSPEPGIRIGRRPDPLDRVGVYAPGGRAAYPSSVLMGAVPARVAGVREVVLCSPPGRDGLPSQVVLAAAALCGVDRVFAIGGAGAIGAMAYSTQSVPRVDRIVGPGNAYVAEAKLQVSGVVGIDSPAGPSELLVIADSTADQDVLVREIMAQAEHDPRAVVVVVTIGEELAESLIRRIADALPSQQRRDIIAQSLQSRGAVVWATDLDEATRFSNRFAPEHLLIATEQPSRLLPELRNAGTIFVGEHSSVSFGDYMTGANHVLPTGGLARSYSGLSVLDFIRWTTYQIVSPAAAASLAEDVGIFADSEALFAHAAAARQWATGVV